MGVLQAPQLAWVKFGVGQQRQRGEAQQPMFPIVTGDMAKAATKWMSAAVALMADVPGGKVVRIGSGVRVTLSGAPDSAQVAIAAKNPHTQPKVRFKVKLDTSPWKQARLNAGAWRLSDGNEGHAYDQHGADRHVHSKSIDDVLKAFEHVAMQGFVRRR
jgi:hypothetical protein